MTQCAAAQRKKLFEKARVLPEPTQAALLQLVESLAASPPLLTPKPAPKVGSAKGLITLGPNFDEPLEDFKLHMEWGSARELGSRAD